MSMTDLQSKLLTMLAWFHEYCKRHELRYYLVEGTALGAARHQGFIPWDDDIDVGMPRADYEKLRVLCKEGEDEKYCFEFPEGKKDFVYPYGKMYDKSTTLVDCTRYKTKRGIFIDIFPLDGVGEEREEGGKRFSKILKKINLYSTKTCALRKGRKLYKNLAIVGMRCVPSFIVSAKKLRKRIDETAREVDFDESKYVVNYFSTWYEKEIVEKSVYGTPTECDFEGITVMRPENVDAYLTALYGDWRTPPPPEKRISHHDYLFLDLEHSYCESTEEK